MLGSNVGLSVHPPVQKVWEVYFDLNLSSKSWPQDQDAAARTTKAPGGRTGFHGVSRGSGKVLLEPAIPNHSMPCGQSTPGRSNGRPGVSKCSISFQGPPNEIRPCQNSNPTGCLHPPCFPDVRSFVAERNCERSDTSNFHLWFRHI
jgi:hypothetical protein